jgi:SAM-dependent methyltransferase
MKVSHDGVREVEVSPTPDLSQEQRVQETQYSFPYHYLPERQGRRFSQHRNLPWGYEYLTYVDFVLDRVAQIGFESLLDVGCGDGRFLREASRRFPDKRLAGIDYSPRAIEMAGSINPGIEFVAGDVTDPGVLDGTFDVVTLIEVLEHIPPDQASHFLAGVARRLSRGGRLIVTVPSNNRPVRPKHYRHFDLESLREALSPHFAIQEHFFLNRHDWLTSLIKGCMTNRLFVLNEPRLAYLLFRLYERRQVVASERSCKRLAVACSRSSTG